MIKKYINFINENIDILKYSIFDWDDNILVMDTIMRFKHKENNKWVITKVNPKKFVKIKEKYPNYCDNIEWKCIPETFHEFRDFGPRGTNAFLEDVIDSVNKQNFGPSWNKFIQTLVDGELFAIVTTRGHEPDTIKKGIEYIIYHYLNDEQQNTMLKNLMRFKDIFDESFDYLIDEYLNNCYFIGVTSNYFKSKFKDYGTNIHLAKKKAVKYVIEKFSNYGKQIDSNVKIGFSDDDNKYIDTIQNLFIRNSELFDNINFYIFNTSNPNIKGGRKFKIN
jgi:hypothetical protein